MENKKDFSKAAVILIALFLVGALLIFAVNIFAAPIIEANNASQAFGALTSVMPDAAGFNLVYDAADPAASTLADVPATVREIYEETSGLGHVVKLSTTEGYTHEPIEFTLAIDDEGKISGVELTAYPDTKDFGADYPLTYIGSDSALSDVSLVAGVTFSSSAFRNAVIDSFNALINNDLIAAGVKGDDQMLAELATEVFPGLANSANVAQFEETEPDGNFASIMVAANGSGAAYIMNTDAGMVLAVCNSFQDCYLYAPDGSDVSADAAYAGAKEEALKRAALDIPPVTDKDELKIKLLAGDGAELTPIDLDGIANTVVAAYSVDVGGQQLYGFVARPYGYSNIPMDMYYVLDENGAIVNMNSAEFILHSEYFSDYTLDEQAYRDGFTGLTVDSLTGEEAFVSGATATTNAVKDSVEDVFEAFAALRQMN